MPPEIRLIPLHDSGPGATGWSNFRPNIGPLSAEFHVYTIDMPARRDEARRHIRMPRVPPAAEPS